MNENIIGVDVAKDENQVALQVTGKIYENVFVNSPKGHRQLLKWLKKQGVEQAHVCLEATGRYGDEVAETLHEAGMKVSIVNPLRIKKYAESQLRRHKTDAIDAKLILDFCATQKPEAWTPPTMAQRELQDLVRHLTALKKMRQQERNRLKSGVTTPAVIKTIEQHLEFLQKQIKQVTQQIDEHIQSHPELKTKHDLVQSIPGIGKLTASYLLAEIPDIGAFDTARDLAAFSGLTPRLHVSGSSIRRQSHISKMGNSRLRAPLYWPAITAIRCNPIVLALHDRLLAKGKCKMVIIVAAMRKLIHIVYGVLKSGRPFDPYISTKRQFAS